MRPPIATMMSTLKGAKNNFWGTKDLDNEIIIPITDPRKDDIIIPVMGPTGVGKSTFINVAAGDDVTDVGHGLNPCTSKIQPFPVPHPHNPTRRIIFIDTTPFNDGFIEDSEILRRIAIWLARSYDEGSKLAGIIYLHDITETRMSGGLSKNLLMFNKLCGDDAAKNVILGTTKWADVVETVGQQREQQLSNEHWKHMLDHGAKTARFTNTSESAWAIVNKILQRDQTEVLLIQHELVDLRKLIPQTAAGLALRHNLQELLEHQKKEARQLRKEVASGDEGTRVGYEEKQRQIRSTQSQIRELEIPLYKQILTFFARQEKSTVKFTTRG